MLTAIPKATLVTPAEIADYKRFALTLTHPYARQPPPILWHYTSAEGMLAILSQGTMFATQIGCLNDTLEGLHLDHEIRSALQDLILTEDKKQTRTAYTFAVNALSSTNAALSFNHVTCFTDKEDDLNQWRGYGAGECGYAIGFNAPRLKRIIQEREIGRLYEVGYSSQDQEVAIEKIISYYREQLYAGSRYSGDDFDTYAREVFIHLALTLDDFAAISKHPKFSEESEWRLKVDMKQSDLGSILFRQKKTLLARHLPVSLLEDPERKNSLPIEAIMIGPGPAQKITEVSVLAYLFQNAYEIPVWLSDVPFRIP